MPTLAWMAHPDGWIFWYNRRWYNYTGTTAEEMAGWGWQSVHHPDILPTVIERWTNAILIGEPFEMVFPLRGADGIFRPFLTRTEPLKENGEIVGWLGTNTEISEQERTRERLQLMVNELNHRVKNTLATVQSIAAQSFASAAPELRRSFDDRLMALARVHEVLTRESWAKAPLPEIVAAALAYCDPARFQASGPDVMIQPRTASALSMTLHELYTNAVKHGALSSAQGTVRVAWHREESRSAPLSVILEWTEQGGPPVVEPVRKSFGSRLIARAMGSEKGASVEHRFDAAGVRCTMRFPVETDVLA